MQLIEYAIQQQSITQACVKRDPISGSAGFVFAHFSFDQEWDGLTITVFFENDSVQSPVAVIWNDKPIRIPLEILTTGTLRVSALGVGADADGNEIRLTTRRMDKGLRIYRSGAETGSPESDASRALWEQVLAVIGPLKDLSTAEKNTLVGAINEVFKNTSGALYVNTIQNGNNISLPVSWDDIASYIAHGREVILIHESEFYRPVNSGENLCFVLFDPGKMLRKVISRNEAATANYSENKIEETDPTVPDWAKAPEKPSYTAEDVGAVGKNDLSLVINEALSRAAASGEFDGPPGDPGVGIDGIYYQGVNNGDALHIVMLTSGRMDEIRIPVPQRGSEYWTAADQKAVTDAAVAAVLEKFPEWKGGYDY